MHTLFKILIYWSLVGYAFFIVFYLYEHYLERVNKRMIVMNVLQSAIWIVLCGPAVLLTIIIVSLFDKEKK